MAKIGINLSKGTIDKQQEKNLIVGIDLGTTNSLVAYFDENSNKAVAVKDQSGDNKLVPSIIHFAKDGSVIVGNQAKSYLVSDPANTIYSIKRLMGKSYNDIEERAAYFGYQIIDEDEERLLKIKVDKKYFTPIELSAEILRELKERVKSALNREVEKAVITVPAYFNDSQRQATRDAGKLAGLDVLRIVNEPTAASLAYGIGLDPSEEKTIAVYDLGGGTFDISILSIQNGIFEVLSTNGDTFLGGDDFDQAIMNHWIKVNELDSATIKEDKALGQALRIKAEEAKKQLSSQDFFSETLHSNIKCELSKEEFNALIKPLVQKSITACERALADAEIEITDIDEVVLVGGSTRVPLVKDTVAQFFAKKPHDELNPDEVVALGASIQADVLAGNRKDVLLLDVTPLSLGVETMGGLMDVIIPRNTKIPSKVGRQYTTQIDGQANMKISVFQGERDQVKHNRKLAEFSLKGIPAMPAGLAKVEINFILNADGILKVSAKELRSGVSQTIDITPQYGISEEDMALMLKDSIVNAKEDMAVRALQEAVNEGSQLADTAVRFLEKNKEFINEAEKQETLHFVNELRKVLDSEDKDEITSKTEELNNFTRPFAERIMDLAVAKAMKGRKI